MPLETATHIHSLDKTNPHETDPLSQSDDHIKLIKSTLKATFNQFTGPVGASNTELNKLNGCTSSTSELNILTGCTATTNDLNVLTGITPTTDELNKLSGLTSDAADLNKIDGLTAEASELNVLDGITNVTTDEINRLEGVTSSIQTQIDGKQDPVVAGGGVVVSGNTISSFGCPYAVVIDSKVEGNGHQLSPTRHDCQVDTIIHSMDPAVTENNDTVYLPAGTYYFEGMAHAYNPSGSRTNNDVRVALYTEDDTFIAHEGVGELGERDGREFTCMGKFTTDGDRFRLRIRASSNGTSYYGRQGHTGIASYIKFWKIV